MANSSIKYHGSPYYFESIDLSKSKGFKDFGCGLYLSSEKQHAISVAEKNSKLTGKKFIYTFEVATKFPESIRRKVFREADIEWLDFVLMNRDNRYTTHNFDIVYGPTADAEIARILDRYKKGYYGNPCSVVAKQELITALKTKRYPRQMCLCTIQSLNYIRILDIQHIL